MAETQQELDDSDCWSKMQEGTTMIKLAGQCGGKARKPKQKTFLLDKKKFSIYYKPTKKKHIRYEIAQMTDVLTGDGVREIFGSLAKKHSLDACISIKFTEDKSMDVIASSTGLAKMWVHGLKTLMENKNDTKKDHALRQQWLIDAFVKFDKNNDGSLDVREVTKLLVALNVHMTSHMIKTKFEEADSKGKENALDKQEFADFFKSISTRSEIVDIMESSPNKTHMELSDLQAFLEQEQGMKDVTKEYCEEIISKYEPTDTGKAKCQLGIDGLTHFLLGAECDLFQQEHDDLYQDMTQPLSHYFIASSHNTYLMMDQLRGPSSVDAYINALMKGCRCVELDCWDGENGEPIVYHGHTLTSKIKFKDIIEAVNKYAFKVSQYPVILSLENHCNIQNQKAIAAHLERILGDTLYKEPIDISRTTLPSPQSLKNKILIKGKKLKSEQENESDEEGDVSDEDEAADIDPDVIAAAENDNGGGEGPSTSAAVAAHKAVSKEKAERKKRSNSFRNSFRAVGRAVRRVKKPNEAESRSKPKVKLAKELSRCVNYISSVGFKSFELSKQHATFYQMSSFSESKLVNLAHHQAAAFIDYNKKQLSRTYPAGNRVESSNYNPQIAWNAGCQIVALNYQTDGEMMHINQGRFRQNQRAGYVLKPEFMRDPSIKFNPKNTQGVQKKLLTINLKSGQQLPKPLGQSTKGEIIDPYVEIKIYGVNSDQATFKSKVIKNNGFNPVWNMEVKHVLNVPDLAMIRFTVFDEDVGLKDDFIGQFCLPFINLLTGYRHVHLLDMKGEPIPHATLFVHVTVDDTNSAKAAKEGRQGYLDNPASPTMS